MDPPVPARLQFATTYPYALAPHLTVAGAAMDGATLRLLSWLSVPLLPAPLGFPVMCWWAFRGQVDQPTFY